MYEYLVAINKLTGKTLINGMLDKNNYLLKDELYEIHPARGFKRKDKNLKISKTFYDLTFKEDIKPVCADWLEGIRKFFNKSYLPENKDKRITLYLNNIKDVQYFNVWKQRKTIKAILLPDGRLLDSCKIIFVKRSKNGLFKGTVIISFESEHYLAFSSKSLINKVHNTYCFSARFCSITTSI